MGDFDLTVRNAHIITQAARKSVIDYSPHLIISETDHRTLAEDLPELIRSGITSFKVFMTYDRLKLDDSQLLDVFAVAAREGALTMVHAENNEVIARGTPAPVAARRAPSPQTQFMRSIFSFDANRNTK